MKSNQSEDQWFSDYRTHEEILQWLDEIAQSETNVETEVIGQTYEGRDMVVIKILRAQEGGEAKNVWIEAGNVACTKLKFAQD